MSEVQSRPSAPRGRGASRGGRAGFGSRGGAGRGGRSHATNGDRPDSASAPSIEGDAGVGLLKKQYGTKVATIKEMYPDWTDEDVVFALQETGGDLELAVERITDGTITQWGEVSKAKKDRSKSKVKETAANIHTDSGNAPRAARSGADSGRGGRGRGSSERARGGRGRGAAAVQTNGTHTKPAAPLSVPTDQSVVWNASTKEAPSDDTKPEESWGGAADIAKAVVSTVVPDGKRTWASMFKAEPAPKPVEKKAPVEKVPEKAAPEAPVEPEATEETPKAEVAEPVVAAKEPVQEEAPAAEAPPAEADVALPPSKDELTETNLEQVLDESGPAPSATVASTAASSWDPRSGATSGTPYSGLQGQPAAARPTTSGFAASAMKATGPAPRVASYQRRVLDQEEAVRMPGNREVDRAAVQFGAFSLGGAGEEDVDGDREEPETRAQPPQHSPIAHPRASLPPAPAQAAAEGLPTAKEPQGLPSAPHPVAAPGLPTPLPGAQSMSQQGSQGGQYSQYGRYGQPAGQEQSAFGQKPYDPFSQQAPATASQYEGYPNQPNQAQTQAQAGAFSSAPSEYSQYYTADQQRHAYQNYYGQQYGQQQSAQAQEGPSTQQRAFSGYNAPPTDTASPFPQSSAQQTQSRYATAGEAQTSGHTTPNPVAQAQQAAQTTQAQQAHPSQPQGQPGAQYPYGNPYYSSPYYAAYMTNYQQGYGQGSYGAGPYGGKGGMYNQPHQYGMSPQAPYDHASSPAAAGAFSQSSLHGRESAVGGGLNEYGRGGSQQSQAAQPLGASGGFDAFGRNSSYQGQGQQYGQGSQQGAGDDLKSFGDAKSANGPAPSTAQAARPGSAANTAPGQSTLPPPQSSQQSYGGYPSHLQQQQHTAHGAQTGSQYGALGGLGAHQAAGQGHQSSQYGGAGGYGQGQGFTGSYYGNNQQQRGGWGNNYQH
ncbi:hypothetical protein V501_07789 [Pseudogymnoascus sp. VKM F-4519 (FW-2642)]|nr:hypothetical protein V501_07789 [Pseudogymnoascus sp. VKM F-4519 (FW-2642)]